MLEQTTLRQGEPEEIEAGIKDFWERVGPTVKQNAGFKRSCLLVDRQNGKTYGVALFDTIQNPQGKADAANQDYSLVDPDAAAGPLHCIMLIIHP
jgi:hypothetical protein